MDHRNTADSLQYPSGLSGEAPEPPLEPPLEFSDSGLLNLDLANQNRLLRTCNDAACMIIGGFHTDYETLLRQTLQVFAESVQATKVAVWRNSRTDDGPYHFFLRSYWQETPLAHDGTQQERTLYSYDALTHNWRQDLAENSIHISNTSELAPQLCQIFGVEPDNEFFYAPIYLNGEFWGMLSMESNVRQHPFVKDEVSTLLMGILVMASSISRNEQFAKLNEAREQAMASTKAKGEFLSRMSHEIRTPMNAIIGMTSIARASDDPQRVAYCLEKIEASSHQLLSLINDILDMSKIDSGKFEINLDEFDFEQMITHVINVIDVKLTEKTQKLAYHLEGALDHLLVGDELRLSQVLINLLNNASKFTPENGEITLSVELAKASEQSDRLRVTVRDTGIGISPENQERLFESFEQADGSITRTYGGTGLGLAICKKIITLMGGDIWVESALGQGSSFIFEVDVAQGAPLAGVKAAGAPASVHTARNWSKYTVLLAEDIEINREIAHALLEETGVVIVDACDGVEAVRLFSEEPQRYKLIMMDLQMPNLDGLSATRQIRALNTQNAQEVPIVAMTANAFKEDVTKSLEAGMNDHLAKPFDVNTLFEMMARYLEK